MKRMIFATALMLASTVASAQKSNFQLKVEIYDKCKGKFEILGVDCNDTEAKWKTAQGFPTKIVVGPDGKIVKTIVDEDPAFYTLLDELLGK